MWRTSGREPRTTHPSRSDGPTGPNARQLLHPPMQRTATLANQMGRATQRTARRRILPDPLTRTVRKDETPARRRNGPLDKRGTMSRKTYSFPSPRKQIPFAITCRVVDVSGGKGLTRPPAADSTRWVGSDPAASRVPFWVPSDRFTRTGGAWPAPRRPPTRAVGRYW